MLDYKQVETSVFKSLHYGSMDQEHKKVIGSHDVCIRPGSLCATCDYAECTSGDVTGCGHVKEEEI